MSKQKKSLNRNFARTRKYGNWIWITALMGVAAIAVIALTGLTISCAASPQSLQARIEYIYELPDVPDFPHFPDPYPVSYDEGTDTVSMPLWYWQKVAEYKIDIDTIECYINQIKEIQK